MQMDVKYAVFCVYMYFGRMCEVVRLVLCYCSTKIVATHCFYCVVPYIQFFFCHNCENFLLLFLSLSDNIQTHKKEQNSKRLSVVEFWIHVYAF